MNVQPVTLRQHDSINLTTGVVTRSSQVAVATSPATLQSAIANGLRRNNLRALAVMIAQQA